MPRIVNADTPPARVASHAFACARSGRLLPDSRVRAGAEGARRPDPRPRGEVQAVRV